MKQFVKNHISYFSPMLEFYTNNTTYDYYINTN